MKKLLFMGIIAVVLLACVGAVSANLVTNPSFESPGVSGAFTTCPGGTCPASWTIGAGENVNFIGPYWTSSDGAQSIDMSGEGSRGSLSQQIPTTANGPYDLTFDMSGNFMCGPDTKTLAVYWDGIQIAGSPFTFVKSGTWSQTTMEWSTKSITLPDPAGSSTELKFVDVSSDVTNCGVALDNVGITGPTTPVPEFPTVALPAALIIGLIGAVLFIQKSKEE
jgi:hypothetical protein